MQSKAQEERATAAEERGAKGQQQAANYLEAAADLLRGVQAGLKVGSLASGKPVGHDGLVRLSP